MKKLILVSAFALCIPFVSHAAPAIDVNPSLGTAKVSGIPSAILRSADSMDYSTFLTVIPTDTSKKGYNINGGIDTETVSGDSAAVHFWMANANPNAPDNSIVSGTYVLHLKIMKDQKTSTPEIKLIPLYDVASAPFAWPSGGTSVRGPSSGSGTPSCSITVDKSVVNPKQSVAISWTTANAKKAKWIPSTAKPAVLKAPNGTAKLHGTKNAKALTPGISSLALEVTGSNKGIVGICSAVVRVASSTPAASTPR